MTLSELIIVNFQHFMIRFVFLFPKEFDLISDIVHYVYIDVDYRVYQFLIIHYSLIVIAVLFSKFIEKYFEQINFLLYKIKEFLERYL